MTNQPAREGDVSPEDPSIDWSLANVLVSEELGNDGSAIA
jgi:hypothetical protein